MSSDFEYKFELNAKSFLSPPAEGGRGSGRGGSHQLRGDGNSTTRTETKRVARPQRPRTVECWAPSVSGKVAALFHHLCVRYGCPFGGRGTALHDGRPPRCTALVVSPRRGAAVGNHPPRSNSKSCPPPAPLRYAGGEKKEARRAVGGERGSRRQPEATRKQRRRRCRLPRKHSLQPPGGEQQEHGGEGGENSQLGKDVHE